jgi:hypothetical protein
VEHRPIHLLVEIEIEGIERAIGITKARLFVSALEQRREEQVAATTCMGEVAISIHSATPISTSNWARS